MNELDQERALKNLRAWVQHNPTFAGLPMEAKPEDDLYGAGNSLMDEVVGLMLRAEAFVPKGDPDVQEVLGVLYNVSRDYGAAAACFERAAGLRPDNHSLWNKPVSLPIFPFLF